MAHRKIGSISMTVEGEPLQLRGDRSLFWPNREVLALADLHLGKAEALRRDGLGSLPYGSTRDDLKRLSRAVAETRARRLLILGDAVHSREGLDARVIEAVTRWRRKHVGLKVQVILGNHDHRAGELPEEWKFQVSSPPLTIAPFDFQHLPEHRSRRFTWAGHIHPAVRLRGAGRQRDRLPCFSISSDLGILPSFGMMTGSHRILPSVGTKIFVIADQQVIEVAHGQSPDPHRG